MLVMSIVYCLLQVLMKSNQQPLSFTFATDNAKLGWIMRQEVYSTLLNEIQYLKTLIWLLYIKISFDQANDYYA